jgi:hypothetical protein
VYQVRRELRGPHMTDFPGSKIKVGQSKTAFISKMHKDARNWTCEYIPQSNFSSSSFGRNCSCLIQAAHLHFSELSHSKFGLVPRGHGVYSYRLVEVMLSGAIPVIISNGWVMPFHDILNWDAFSIRIDEFKFMEHSDKWLSIILDKVGREPILFTELLHVKRT